MEVLRGRAPECAVSANDVSRWFGPRIKPTIGQAHCEQVAMFINGCFWPGDPELTRGTPGYLEQDDDKCDDRLRELSQVATAARSLRKHITTTISFWERQHWANQNENALREMSDLCNALDVAMRHLEFPYGPIDRQRGQPQASKSWHIYAPIICNAAMEAMAAAGHPKSSIARSSVVVRLVRSAMIRMEIERARTLSTSCISAFLVRWERSYWLPRKSQSALTTESTCANL